MSTVILLTSASGSPWAVPADWNSASNTIELIGAGGSGVVGHAGAGPPGAGGGGGGAYTKYTNVVLTPSGTMAIQIGAGGSVTDTFAVNAATMLAKAGANGSGVTGGAGGATTAIGTPTTSNAGGSGGTSAAGTGNHFVGGGGGGGAGNKNGNGANGGSLTGTDSISGGGGGGTGGGTNGGGGAASANGGAGGARSGGGGGGTGGIVGGADATAGTGNNQGAGGGGGGAANNAGKNAAVGGPGAEYTITAGGTAGAGGGGGGGGSNAAAGKAGGLYGGGGGGGGSDTYGGGGALGAGAGGAIIITYTPSVSATDFTISGGSTGVSPGGTTLNFTLVANGTVAGGTATFTLSDGGAGGTFTPSSPTIAVAASSVTFTYTAAAGALIGATVNLTATCAGGGAMNATTHTTGAVSQSPSVVIISGNFGGVGDSITAGTNASSGTGANAAVSVAKTDWLSNFLYCLKTLPGGPYPILGNGQGAVGTTSGTWSATQYTTAKAAWLAQGTSLFTIMLGTNDSQVGARTSNATYKANIAAIIAQLQTDFVGCKILLLCPPWYDGAQWAANGGSAAVYSATSVGAIDGSDGTGLNYFAQLQSLADNVNVFCGTKNAFNWFKATDAASGFAACLSIDGLHPNDTGYKALGHFAFEDFRKIFFPDAGAPPPPPPPPPPGTSRSGGIARGIIGGN